MNGSIARRDDAQYFFFRSISNPISGHKAPQPVLRTVLVYQ